MQTCRFCGLKLSIFGIVLSAWGILQLSLMALAFYKNSVAMAKDLPDKTFTDALEVSRGNITKMVDTMNSMYEQQAINCAVAAGLYVLTFLVSLHQFWINRAQDKRIRLLRQSNSIR